jgi:RNA recognition motif-containing protein
MGKRLYVGNLPYDISEQSIADAFAQDGRKVERISIVLDRETGRPRGFAFVEMATDEDAKKAIAVMDGAELNGRRLRVNEAEDRRPGGPRPPGGPGGPPRDRAGPRPGGDAPSGGGSGGGPGGGGSDPMARPRPWQGGGFGQDATPKRTYEKKPQRRRHDDAPDDGGRRGARRFDDDDE